jgi:hypothetical protein
VLNEHIKRTSANCRCSLSIHTMSASTPIKMNGEELEKNEEEDNNGKQKINDTLQAVTKSVEKDFQRYLENDAETETTQDASRSISENVDVTAETHTIESTGPPAKEAAASPTKETTASPAREAASSKSKTDGTTSTAIPTTENERPHAKIQDIIEPPVRQPSIRTPPDDSILGRLFDPDRKQKPGLWEHIKLVAPGPANSPPNGLPKWRSKDAVAAYCLVCKKQFTYTKGTSKTVSRHMAAYHGLHDTNRVKHIKAECLPETTTDSLKSPSANEPPLKKRKVAFSGHPLVLKWLVSSFRPLSSVEDPGLADLLNHVAAADRRFELPTPDILVELAKTTQTKVEALLQTRLRAECNYYSLTVQAFTSSRWEEHASINCTYVTPSFERKSCTLAVVPMTNTADCLNNAIESTMEKYNLSKDRLTGVIKGAATLSISKDFACRTCVTTSMNSVVKEVLQKGKAGRWLSLIKSRVEKWNVDSGPKDKIVVQTSDNYSYSTYRMLKHLLVSQSKVNQQEGTEHFTPEDWAGAQGLVDMLRPLSDAAATFSGEQYPTVGLCIPVLRRIRDVLEETEWKPELVRCPTMLKTMKECLQALLKSYKSMFSAILDESKYPEYMWTMPLDPRLVSMKGLSEEEKKSVVKSLVEEVKKMEIVGKEVDKPSDATNAEDATMGGIFWGDDTDTKDSPAKSTDISAAYAQASVDRYFHTVRSHRRMEDPLIWWKDNHVHFPELAQLARKWLGCCATHMAAGKLCNLDDPTEKRKRQYGESHLEVVAFLHDNVDLL